MRDNRALYIAEQKRAAYRFFAFLWALEVLLVGMNWERALGTLNLPTLMSYLALCFVGVVTLAHVCSFESVGKWFRDGITQTVHDSAGGKMSIEPREDMHPFMIVMAELICCPICVGAHIANLMLLTFEISHGMGWAIAASTFIASGAMLLHHLSQKWEWEARVAIERQGMYWYDKAYGKYAPMASLWAKGMTREQYQEELIQHSDQIMEEMERWVTKNGDRR